MKVKVVGYKPIEITMEVSDKYAYLLKSDDELEAEDGFSKAVDLMYELFNEAEDNTDFEWVDRVYTADGNKCLACD